ncbi:magnesium transporter CorA family protein [Caldisalinibacter kiritimatiensis]|uniref:Magnesium and cobalt transport protein CorA n=1 Tax=Caldisalinibacter kiritimatiensis TaxID=1304284 RepID=R1CYP8_9FIRM|nr:magnesium transporter CorA family protein [Caldisalinibacter kiritimatiensis]EOD01709.1 Magnesium and cobalt transport protein CorA [Caldisalinibacter kiritimatiensis]
MLNIYKTVEGSLLELNEFEEGCWINLIKPTDEEIQSIHKNLGVEMDFLKAPLDDEESSRIEVENEQVFILVDIPIVEEYEGSYVYSTLPLGIILKGKYIITICLKENYIIQQFEQNKVRSFFTYKRTRFVLQLLYRMATRYLLYLKQIDKMSNEIERQLHRSMKNKELIQLLDLEKSLVYFSTSLRANEIVLEKLLKTDAVKLYPDDQDLLEDVIIENKQAIEMANIYSNILSGMMDAFASVISNNLNIVMKILTSITIVMAIPTMFASFYGMNVALPLQNSPYAFSTIVGLSVIVSVIVAVFLAKRNMF